VIKCFKAILLFEGEAELYELNVTSNLYLEKKIETTKQVILQSYKNQEVAKTLYSDSEGLLNERQGLYLYGERLNEAHITSYIKDQLLR